MAFTLLGHGHLGPTGVRPKQMGGCKVPELGDFGYTHALNLPANFSAKL